MCVILKDLMIANSSAPVAGDAYRKMVRMIADAHLRAEERAKATHGRFNIFTTLLKENDEVRLHTRFLHSLLNPAGLHDCGPLFLDLFLRILPNCTRQEVDGTRSTVDWPTEGSWTVHKEAGRSEGFGQIDLLLEHREFCIAIENKIHASEGDRQLASYSKFLKARHARNSALIFLTLDGRESSTHEGAEYARISYREHILTWLEACLRETYHIIPLNLLLIQYREVVRKLAGQTLQSAMMKPIAEFAAEHSDVIRYRSQWNAAVDEAKRLFMDRIGSALIESLSTSFQIAYDPDNEDDRFSTENSGLIIRREGWPGIVPERFMVYIENDLTVLALGIFVGYEDFNLSTSEAAWVEQVIVEWSNHAELGPIKEDGPTPPWPLGWINLLEHDLNDEGYAKMMEEPFHHLIEGIKARALDYLSSLETVCREVSAASIQVDS
jgi:hypothetical protein